MQASHEENHKFRLSALKFSSKSRRIAHWCWDNLSTFTSVSQRGIRFPLKDWIQLALKSTVFLAKLFDFLLGVSAYGRGLLLNFRNGFVRSFKLGV